MPWYAFLLNKALVILVTIVVIIFLFIPGYLICKKAKRPKLGITLYVFTLILILKIYVTYSGEIVISDGLPVTELSWSEKFIDSILHTFQTFSMDEDYTQYILEGKRILKSHQLELLSKVYGFITSILYLTAPVLAGSIVLDFVANTFPIIRLWMHPFCHKFVFSELNEMSICLAEDIANGKYKTIIQLKRFERKPLIIFTDAYTDDESETSAELLSRAKVIHAICIKDDLSEISFKHSKSITYLLMDKEDSSSISSFSYLMKSEKNRPKYKKEVKKLCLTVTLDREYTINEYDFLNTIAFNLTTTDMFGNEEKLYDINGNEVSSDDFKTYAVKCKVLRTQDNKTQIKVYFDFSSRVLDSSKPFSLTIKEIESRIPNIDKKKVEYKTNLPDLPTHIFLFVQDDCYAEIANKVYVNSKENTYQVVSRVIRDYKNTAINLMSRVPLFMPLLYKDQNSRNELNITILGGGRIAQEVFKAIYWCGQIPNVKLNITVLTEKVKEFRNGISAACPELFDSCEENSPLLSVFIHDPAIVNPPYVNSLTIRPVWDVRNLRLIPHPILLKTDYFVVALGSDEKAVEMTNLLCSELAKLKLAKESGKGSVIVPAIFNRDIADVVINRKPVNLLTETFVIPFAMLDERFNCENVFMERHIDSANATAEMYNRAHQIQQQKDEYSYWANIARALHAPYKLFGFGLLELANGEQTAITGKPQDMYHVINGTNFSSIQALEPLQSWIEHRRWNAFMRAQGFRSMPQKEFKPYFKISGIQKSLQLKLHSCLVESSPVGGEPLPDSPGYDPTKYDRLDFVSMMIHHAKMEKNGAPEADYYGTQLQEADYKQWDFAEYDDAIKKLLE